MQACIETREYRSYAEDFVETSDQDHRLPDGYRWIDGSRSGKVRYSLLHGIGYVLATIYEKVILGRRIGDKEAIERFNEEDGGGYFIYANHTQPVGDAALPMLLSFPKRAYVVVSPSNLGIPVIGPMLPYFGALPIPDSMSGLKEMSNAIETRLDEGSAVVIYPEAHLWPWHTGIRPLPASAFSYPVTTGHPVFAATTTYHHGRFRKHPRATVYVDGPFYPDESLPKPRRKEKLRDQVQQAMEARSELSTFEYIRYVPAPDSGLEDTHPSRRAVDAEPDASPEGHMGANGADAADGGHGAAREFGGSAS